jgi:hypothetical protein
MALHPIAAAASAGIWLLASAVISPATVGEATAIDRSAM